MVAHDPRTAQDKEIFVAIKEPSPEAGFASGRFPIRSAAVLVGIYLATYLSVGVIAHVLSSPNAPAAIPQASSAAPSAAATAPAFAGNEDESRPSHPPRQAPEQADNSRECRPRSGIDAECIFN